MAVVLAPDRVVRSKDRHVAIELGGQLTRGATVVDWEDRMRREANARIVIEMDQGRFEELVRNALGAT